jgi:hypothetical protein
MSPVTIYEGMVMKWHRANRVNDIDRALNDMGDDDDIDDWIDRLKPSDIPGPDDPSTIARALGWLKRNV